MDIEGTMAFILEQQAKFETDIRMINESLKEVKETSTRHTEAIAGLVEAGRLQAARSDRLEQGLVSIAEAHNRLVDAVREGRREFEQRSELQDRRLSEFIAQVSRYLAGRNGG